MTSAASKVKTEFKLKFKTYVMTRDESLVVLFLAVNPHLTRFHYQKLSTRITCALQSFVDIICKHRGQNVRTLRFQIGFRLLRVALTTSINRNLDSKWFFLYRSVLTYFRSGATLEQFSFKRFTLMLYWDRLQS